MCPPAPHMALGNSILQKWPEPSLLRLRSSKPASSRAIFCRYPSGLVRSNSGIPANIMFQHTNWDESRALGLRITPCPENREPKGQLISPHQGTSGVKSSLGCLPRGSTQSGTLMSHFADFHSPHSAGLSASSASLTLRGSSLQHATCPTQ